MTDTIIEQLYVPIIHCGIFLPTTAPSVPLKLLFLSEDDDFDSRGLRCICEACHGAATGCKWRGARLQNRLCACSKTGFVPTLNQPLQNRLCVCSKTGFVAMLNLPHQNRLCAYAKPTAPKPALSLLQNRLCAYATPAAPKPALYQILRLIVCT